MTNQEARKVLVFGDWYNQLPEEYQDSSSEAGNELLDAIGMAQEALDYDVRIIEFNHKRAIHIRVPDEVTIDRVFVEHSGTNRSSLYYPE